LPIGHLPSTKNPLWHTKGGNDNAQLNDSDPAERATASGAPSSGVSPNAAGLAVVAPGSATSRKGVLPMNAHRIPSAS
jgi:hypothetical protein